MDDRNALFQRLKPSCVGLSQAALKLSHSHASSQTAIQQHLETIKATLDQSTKRFEALNEKLADYVFFPLSQLLRSSQKLSVRNLELCLQCIPPLVQHGWERSIQSQLAAQLVILCTLLADKAPKGFVFEGSTDDLRAAAFVCLYRIYEIVRGNRDVVGTFTSDAHFPQLGQTVTVLLEGIQSGSSAEVQRPATDALNSLVENVLTRDLCASFLPGIVSKLVRVISPNTSQRRSHRVLIGCLQIVSSLVKRTLGRSGRSTTTSIIDDDWVSNSQKQLNRALLDIYRIRQHERHDVKEALAELCSMLVRECRDILVDCLEPALETLITVVSDERLYMIRQAFQSSLVSEVQIANLLQTLLYNWQHALATVMQSADEQIKLARLEHISTAYKLLMSAGVNMTTLDSGLFNAVKDGVVLTLRMTKNSNLVADMGNIQSLDLVSHNNETSASTQFTQVLTASVGQGRILQALKNLTELLAQSTVPSSIVSNWGSDLIASTGDVQLATFWLSLEFIGASRDHKKCLDFLDLDELQSSDEVIMEEMYAFALAKLSDVEDDQTDPRLLSLCLRAVALKAQSAGEDFRYELVEALYPVLHTLATPNETLQRDSIAALNIIKTACAFESVRDLIVENADYLTNAVALRLNSFDLSPQAPFVLLMMVRLAGPAVLPFLEDTVESIFAALQDFHGYPILVELLFKVLAAMVEEGVKVPQLNIAGRGLIEPASSSPNVNSITSMEELISSAQKDLADQRTHAPTMHEEFMPHPQAAWKGWEPPNLDAGNAPSDDEEEQQPSSELQSQEEPEDLPPAPRLYSLLLKIAQSTQHYLPSASASLRASLLSLIQTAVPALAQHENSFLPLINTIWPEITSRLEDDEFHARVGALKSMAILVEYAGEFMRSRIVEIWPLLSEIYQRLVKEIVASSGPSKKRILSRVQREVSLDSDVNLAIAKFEDRPDEWSNTALRMEWNSLIDALVTFVNRVPISPDMFDDVLEMLSPMIEQERIQKVLERKNADAVWLLQLRRGLLAPPDMPVVADGEDWAFAPAVVS